MLSSLQHQPEETVNSRNKPRETFERFHASSIFLIAHFVRCAHVADSLARLRCAPPSCRGTRMPCENPLAGLEVSYGGFKYDRQQRFQGYRHAPDTARRAREGDGARQIRCGLCPAGDVA